MIFLVFFISVFIWADNELNTVLGKSTEVINISSIVKPSTTIQIKNTNSGANYNPAMSNILHILDPSIMTNYV